MLLLRPRLWTILLFVMACRTLPELLADPSPSPGAVAITPAPAVSGVPGSMKKNDPLDDDDDNDSQHEASATPTASQPPGRNLFGLLDSRSSYGTDVFPDPFLGPEFDRETQLEVDYAHGQKGNQQSNEAEAAFQWNFVEQFTLSGEFGYDSEHERTAPGVTDAQDAKGGSARGLESVDLAVYHPIYQFIGPEGGFDYTAVGRLDLGIPTRTAVSGDDFTLTPYLGQLLQVGQHISVEAWTGSQFTFASHRTQQLIYGGVLGYKITRNQAALPLTRSVTPIVELDGQTPFSHPGGNALFGVVGFNWQCTSWKKLHPRVAAGCRFPLDRGARDALHWGIITQVFFDL